MGKRKESAEVGGKQERVMKNNCDKKTYMD